MKYLITVYEDNDDPNVHPIVKDEMIVDEKRMWAYLQNNRTNGAKFEIYEIGNCILDYS